MQTKKTTKKMTARTRKLLALGRETVCSLNARELGKAAGGLTLGCAIPPTTWCWGAQNHNQNLVRARRSVTKERPLALKNKNVRALSVRELGAVVGGAFGHPPTGTDR
jgi:hypothetical protein